MSSANPAVAAAQKSPLACDLVCEGGGVKGVGLAGAFSVLEERGYTIENVAGTSAGAITAALIAAKYDASELRDIVFGMDFEQFLDEGWEDRIPGVGKAASVLLDTGIYEGDVFREWIADLLEKHNVETFGDLRTGDADPRYAHKLQVIASDVTARQLLVLPRDAAVLGLKPDELNVALAVRMSMSIPIFFEPVRVENAETNREHLIVDGGMLSNFPVWLFDSDPGEVPTWPTFGLLLVEPEPRTPISARLPESGARAPRGTGPRGAARRHGAHDDGGARPALRRAGAVRTHDPGQDARRRDDRVRPLGGAEARPLQLRAHGRGGVPRKLGLRGLHHRVPSGQGAPAPRGGHEGNARRSRGHLMREPERYQRWLKHDINEVIDGLKLPELQKHALRSRWVDRVVWTATAGGTSAARPSG